MGRYYYDDSNNVVNLKDAEEVLAANYEDAVNHLYDVIEK